MTVLCLAKAILPGILYLEQGPCHVVCRPPARLDVARVAAAANAPTPGQQGNER